MNNLPEKLKKLIALINGDQNPIIRITEAAATSDTVDYQAEMLCRCVSYRDVSFGYEIVVAVITDFSEFEEYNNAFDEPIWYNNNGREKVKWRESSHYPKNKRSPIYLGKDTDDFFEIVESVPLVEEFAKSEHTNYVKFLEEAVTKARAELQELTYLSRLS